MTSLPSERNKLPGLGLIGRQQELAVLTGALDDALSGRGQLVMLAGEPGIGKTRLAHELADLAEQRGVGVLRGWCYEHRGAPPYWPWLQCIRAYVETAESDQLRQDMGPGAADIAEILPELAAKLEGLERPPALEPEQARFRLFFSITSLLKNISRSRPVVLVLDDLHWADESSLLLLEFLAREIAPSPVLIVGTYRDVEVTGDHPLSRTLGNLVREPHFRRVQLEGLSRQEVEEFVEVRAGVSVADAAIDILHQRTEGNPLFVGEVVGSVDPEELARDQAWAAAIPEAVREAILRRLSRLSEPCNQLLRTASVIGRDFDLPLLRDLSLELAEDEFLASLDEASDIRIIETLPAGLAGYRFSHALIQQAVYEGLPPMRKAQAHAAVAATLEERHSNNLEEHAGELAHHFAEAVAVAGTEKLVRYSIMAGERALATFGYEQALVHFKRVLAAKDGQADDAETAAALFGLGRAQATTLPRHEMGRAQLNLSRAFDYYESVGDTTRVVAIAFEFPHPRIGEDTRRSEGQIARALKLVPDNSLEAGRLHSVHGNIQGLVVGDYPKAQDSFDRALAIARREGDVDLEMRALNYSAQVDWRHFCHLEDSLKHSLLAIDLAVSASNPRSEVTARYYASMISNTLGDTGEAQRQASAILQPAERLRDRFWLATAYFCIAFPHTLRGNWELGRAANQRGLDLMPMDPRLLAQGAQLAAQAGDRQQTEGHLNRMEEVALQFESESGSNTPNALLALAFPLAKNILGTSLLSDVGEASIASVLSSRSADLFFPTFARMGGSLLAVMNDDSEAAAEFYAALEPMTGIVVNFLNLDRCLGLLTAAMGDLTTATGHFQDAYDFCRKAGHWPELAWTCHDHARSLLGRDGPGDRENAASLFEESRSIAAELDMAPLLNKVTALQEEMASRPSKGPAYPGGLTAREVDVLRLICGGKTDREIGEELFISVKTVGNHVSNILNKTGTANRTEAATYAALNGIATDPKIG